MKKRIWWLIAIGVLLMGAGMLGSGAVLAAGRGSASLSADDIAVTAQAGATQDAATLSLTNIDDIRTALKDAQIAWWANGRGSIGTDTRNTTADVYAVSGNFQDFHHMDMLYGSFLPRTEKGASAVVLDSDLAYRLFGTVNAVGLEVLYGGKTFEVCGVCKADGSLIGMLSGDGLYRAYVTGHDLVATGAMAVGGLEVTLPRDAPGASLSAVQSALQDEGKSPSSFLMTDRSQRQALDAEVALIPMALFILSAAVCLLMLFLNVAAGVTRESVALIRSNYFSDVVGAVLLRLLKLVLVLGCSAGVVWLMWEGMNLQFLLPAKYIPSSWIDPTFYSSLIKSETQAAIAAASYPRLWWDYAYGAGAQLSGIFSVAALLGGLLAGLGLRALAGDRLALEAQGAPVTGLGDLPLLWFFALAAFGLTMGLTIWMGLPIFTAIRSLYVLGLGLMAWALALHRRQVEAMLYQRPAEDALSLYPSP